MIASKLLILSCLLVAFAEGERFALLLNCIVLRSHAGTTTGFMDLNLLKKRAEKIPNTGISSNFLDNDFRLITGMNFTCSGSLASLLLAVDVRPGGSRTLYPEVQIWRAQNANNKYNLQASQQIILAAGDFSPHGVLRYTLSPELSFQNGDVLGVWQPASSSSVVRLYHDGQTGGPQFYETSYNPGGLILVSNAGSISTASTILIHAITTGLVEIILLMYEIVYVYCTHVCLF